MVWVVSLVLCVLVVCFVFWVVEVCVKMIFKVVIIGIDRKIFVILFSWLLVSRFRIIMSGFIFMFLFIR